MENNELLLVANTNNTIVNNELNSNEDENIESEKIEEKNLDNLIPLNNELFHYHGDSNIEKNNNIENKNYIINNDDNIESKNYIINNDDNIESKNYIINNDNNIESKNYIINNDDNIESENYIINNDNNIESKDYITDDNNNYPLSKTSIQLLKNEISCKHKISVISEESESDDNISNIKNQNQNQNEDIALNVNKDIENNIIREENEDNQNKENIQNSKTKINDNIFSNELSSSSISHDKKDINKNLNDNESFNFETSSITNDKSNTNTISSSNSINKESTENIKESYNFATSNDAISIQPDDFSRSEINFGYNNDFDYLAYFKKAEDYIKTYKIDNEDEHNKNLILYKPFYSIANSIISKYLNNDEKIASSIFYTSHVNYIYNIKKNVTLDFIWNFPIAQIYLLMFLIHRNTELANIFLFYIEADNFRINSPHTISLIRKQQSSKIFKSYFVQTSETYIDWKHFIEDIPISKLYNKLKDQLDLGLSTMYNDYLFLSMLIMEKIFYGEEILSSNIDDFKKDKKNKNISSDGQLIIESFENSVFYQEMINDSIFRSYATSSMNLKRAAERILNMPINYFYSIETLKKISKYLIRIGVDKQIISESKIMQQINIKGGREESIKHKLNRSNTHNDTISFSRKGSESGKLSNLMRTLSSRSSKSYKNNNENRDTDIITHRLSISNKGNKTRNKLMRTLSSRSSKSSKSNFENRDIKIDTNTNNQSENELSTNHIFMKYTDTKFSMCEYCFDDKHINKKDLKSLYQCERCNMIVHKCCRKLILIDCMENKTSVYDKYEGDDEEIIIKIKERIETINNEIRQEESLQSNYKREHELSSKNISEKNSSILVDHSLQKVNNLKNELNMNNMYLIKLEAKVREKKKLQENNKIEKSFKEINVKYMKKGETTNLKVEVQETDTTSEIILNLINILNLTGNFNDYTLNYISKNNNEIELMYTESPLKSIVESDNIKFILRNINVKNRRDSKHSYNFGKRLNIANEIYENEKNYLKKIIQIRSFFIEPMTSSKLFALKDINIIFDNVLNILESHKILMKSMNEIWRNVDDIIELEEKLIQIYIDILPRMSQEYCHYCLNRSIGDELMVKLSNENPRIKDFISDCENKNKEVLNNLTLRDLLTEPLYRISRYIIYFKRLSSYINYPSHKINVLLSQLEKEMEKINIAIREIKLKQEVIKIENNLDWNDIFNKFHIDCDQRKLLNTQEFTLIDKCEHHSKVTVYSFNDLILVIKVNNNIPILCIPPIPYECINIIDCKEATGIDIENNIKIIHNQRNIYIFQANSYHEKKNWLNDITLIKQSFCLSLYVSKNKPTTILRKDIENKIESKPSNDKISVINNDSKKGFLSTIFDRNGRRNSTTTATVNSGKLKNNFLGRRFSLNKRKDLFNKSSGKGNIENDIIKEDE